VHGRKRGNRAFISLHSRTIDTEADSFEGYMMKRSLTCLIAILLLAWPLILHAQYADDDDLQNPNQYHDTWDGQALKLVSYILTPVGMALEWGLTRPLHYASTRTPAAPLLSGDTRGSYLDRNNNAAKVPPGTFGPYATNPSNATDAAGSGQALPPVTPAAPSSLPPNQIQPADPAEQPGGQPVIR
jgi:hypothetical protein